MIRHAGTQDIPDHVVGMPGRTQLVAAADLVDHLSELVVPQMPIGECGNLLMDCGCVLHLIHLLTNACQIGCPAKA